MIYMIRPDDIGNENYVRCGFRDCHQCCKETEMLLTLEDVKNIESLGHKSKEFTLHLNETDGFYQLKNIESDLGNICYFLGDDGKCSIYDNRPHGCKLYPLILNLETNEVMIDFDCREQVWFREQQFHESQVISIHSLVKKLILENEERQD